MHPHCPGNCFEHRRDMLVSCYSFVKRMNGVPLMVVAKNLGHTDTRMVEKHYGHLAPGMWQTPSAGAPKFGIKPEKTNVKALR
jgi:hypothetical protein